MKIYPLIRGLLFRFDPELVHKLTLNVIAAAGKAGVFGSLMDSIYAVPAHPVHAFGLTFQNPIGLAAGYDKDGLGWRGLACLGFSHIEVGTVTPKPQPGNPKPRLFRLPDDHALINRMGFPGMGAEFVLKQVSNSRPKKLVLGINIGKNKDTPLENANLDYIYLLHMFAGQADYITINVSSPNTEGLRQLQERQALDNLLHTLMVEKQSLSAANSQSVPILVKLSPDLSDAQLNDALDAILANQVDGVIATNTTLHRDGLRSPYSHEDGGLSGEPLFQLSLDMVKKIQRYTGGMLPVIGVGGIYNASSVRMMLDAGAVLVQVYTGLVYEGPGLVSSILRQLYNPRT